MELNRGSCLQRDLRGPGSLPIRLRPAVYHTCRYLRGHTDGRHSGGKHAGHHSHRHGEGPEEHTELVHSQPGGGRLLPGSGHHALLLGQRDNGLLDIRVLVVRHTLGHGRATVHREHHESVSHQFG